MNDQIIFDAENINVTYQADMFDGILAITEYEGNQVDVFSIKQSASHLSTKLEVKHWGDNRGTWKVTKYCPINVDQFIEAIEEDPYLNGLDSNGFGLIADFIRWLGIDLNLDSLLFFNEVLHWVRFDYPKIYVLLLWAKREQLPHNYRSLDVGTELLDLTLGVKLKKTQLKNLRKLDTNNVATSILIDAAEIIINHFDSVKEMILHEKTIHPAALVTVQYSPHLLSIKWLHPMLKAGLHEDVIDEIEPLLEFTYRLGVRLGKATNFEQFYTQTITSVEHLKALHERWQEELDEKEMAAKFAEIDDDQKFPKPPLEENAFFKFVSTAGELRSIGEELKNCAAHLVFEALEGKSAYLRYEGELGKKEVGLLEVSIEYSPKTDKFSYWVNEFASFRNQPPSELAKHDLRQWVAQQNEIVQINDDSRFNEDLCPRIRELTAQMVERMRANPDAPPDFWLGELRAQFDDDPPPF